MNQLAQGEGRATCARLALTSTLFCSLTDFWNSAQTSMLDVGPFGTLMQDAVCSIAIGRI
ncbi:TPA: hypothetical protein L6B04_08355 [Pseudomonas aeruginosa]|nr:hypothetical protein [Pseudomonas aeruginosa]